MTPLDLVIQHVTAANRPGSHAAILLREVERLRGIEGVLEGQIDTMGTEIADLRAALAHQTALLAVERGEVPMLTEGELDAYLNTAAARRSFRTKWSAEDGEWVATCDQFPSLSWLSPNEGAALAGIMKLVADADLDARCRCGAMSDADCGSMPSRHCGMWDYTEEELRAVDDGCCHRTRLRGAPCPVGRVCPWDIVDKVK